MRAILPFVTTLALATACGPAPTTPQTATPTTTPTSATENAQCPGEAHVTWDTFAHGFFMSRCEVCHASTSPNRRGAPEGVRFDDESQARALADQVRARVLVDAPTMPPGGGVSDEERALLDIWLRCDLNEQGSGE